MTSATTQPARCDRFIIAERAELDSLGELDRLAGSRQP